MKIKIFPYVVAISAFLIAGSAAFFSVFGLSKLFAGAKLSVIIMAGSLELGKLVTASFLYRYWDTANKAIRAYLSVGLVVLVLITSAGIFGYLSNAYQGASLTLNKQMAQETYYEELIIQLEGDKQFLKEELKSSITSLPDNYGTAKRKIRENYNPRILAVGDKILDTKNKLADLKVAILETDVDVGPAIYLAKIFDSDVDTVVKFFIFILIFVFDPMAVILVVAANMVFLDSLAKIKDSTDKTDDLMNDLYSRHQRNKLQVYGDEKLKPIVPTVKPKVKLEEVIEEDSPKKIPANRKGGHTPTGS